MAIGQREGRFRSSKYHASSEGAIVERTHVPVDGLRYSTNMIRSTRTRFFALALIGQLACTNAAVDKAVGTASSDTAVVVARGERGITVENKAGRPLLNIRLVIEGRDNGTAFAYTLPTLDTGATREVPFADFRSDDGTLFEAGSIAAKQVKTTARDTLEHDHDVTTPW